MDSRCQEIERLRRELAAERAESARLREILTEYQSSIGEALRSAGLELDAARAVLQ